jgi:uncharacterized protein
MKYLIVVLVIALVVWLVLRSKAEKPAARGPATKALPEAMLQCSHCGIHLPRAEALLDERGAFCTEAHRLAGPRAS